MSKKVVLSGYFGFKNFGDEVILSLLIKKLKEYNSNISVITSNPEYTNSLYSDINCIKTFDIKNIIFNIAKTDILISGGGSLLQDATSLKSLFYYLFIIFTGLFFHKKVIIFAQGIGPINNKFGQFVTKLLLKHCTAVSVRDNTSAELLKKWGINATLVCDPVFSLELHSQIKKHSVGVQLRNFRRVDKCFIDKLAQTITDNFKGYDVDVFSLQDSLDLEICRDFKSSIQELDSNINVNVYSAMTFNEITERIAGCEYFVGMRFHSLIISMMSGAKTLGVNYDIKVKKLADEFDIPLIPLSSDISTDKFEELKNQDVEKVNSKLLNKKFDWQVLTDLL